MTQAPSRVGSRYEVIDVLGRGGMAVVYRVKDRGRAGELALKQLAASGSSSRGRDVRALFEREFKVLAELRHPSVVEVHDFGVEATGPYYTMELLDGGDLSAASPLPYARACELMTQICSSLSVLHSRGFVHRDVSPRNVRFTRHGAAKLIDFGAMVPMGPCGQGVGTPGFVAPEVAHHLQLDARTDVFSVGATLYYALTGRRPFAARTFAELPAAWLKGPEPLGLDAGAMHAALEELIFAMLQLDPARRPRNAFEVRQRLAAISGKPLADSTEISQAYVSTPVLVGRDAELRQFKHFLRRSRDGDGVGVSIRGAPGSGRSRLLDTCVLELMTSGAIVLHAAGRGARADPFVTAHRLAEQLLEAMPAEALACAVSAEALDPLFDGSRLQPVSHWLERRVGIQEAIQRWFTRVAQSRPLAIAVDDVERIDEASLALLVALVDAAAGRSLLVVTTMADTVDATASPALVLLRANSSALSLAPLTPAETDALFTSVFSGAPYVSLVSDRVRRLSAGNPRDALKLAQHMIERGLIRFAEGSWTLPSELSVRDLPASAEDALRAHVDELPELPRSLLEAQALALEGPWTLADYLALEPGYSAEQIAGAVTTLQRLALLVEAEGAHTLSHPGVRACVTAQLSAASRMSRERALAEFCARTERPALVEVMHWLAGEAFERGLERLATLLKDAPAAAALYEHASGVHGLTIGRVLERAYEAACASARPARERYELQRLLVEHSVTSDNGFYYRHARDWLERLELDSGLVDYRVGDSGKTPAERVQVALQAAVARYGATPESERVYRPDEAIRMLARYVTFSIAIGSRTMDTQLLSSLAALLEPYSGLTPLLFALWQNACAIVDLAYKGRFEVARARLIGIYRSLEDPKLKDVPHLSGVRHAVAYGLALIDVSLGDPSAEQWLSAIEGDPLQRVSALYLRRAQSLLDGDTERAESYRKQAEVLALQASARQIFDPPVTLELYVQMQVGDLTGVKQVADRAARLAAQWPGWVGLHHLAQASFDRLRGDLSSAKAAYERALAHEDPYRSGPPPMLRVWSIAAEGYVSVLEASGLVEQAYAFGRRACSMCERLELSGADGIGRAQARVEARLGRFADAGLRLDALIEKRAALRPSQRALDYEARACVAIWAEDGAGATRFARLAVGAAAAHGGAMRGRLLDEARRVGLDLEFEQVGTEPVRSVSVAQSAKTHANAAVAMVAAAFGPLPDASARAQRALALLAEALGASQGQLYYAEGAVVARRAVLGTPDAALDRFVSGYWRHRQEQAAITTVFTVSEVDGFALSTVSWKSSSGVRYALIPLSPIGEAECVGVVALVPATSDIPEQYWRLSAAISVCLLASGDLEAVSAG